MIKILLICLLHFGLSIASPLAFPGAEGYGAASIGGRGGKTIYVYSLADSGAGTLRAAIDAKGPRTVVFAVSGIIHAKKLLIIKNPNITIAGQTSPADGITIIGSGFYITTTEVIIRHLRIRPGDTTQAVACDNRDAISIGANSNNIMVDHVSMSWAVDEIFSTWFNAKNITVQNSILSECLYYSCHSKGRHSKGLLVGDSTKFVSIHHNYFAHNDDRNPTIKPYSKSDFVNNIVYNWGTIGYHFNCDYCINNNDTAASNNIYNYYKRGPSTSSSFFTPGSSQSYGLFKIHINKNDGDDSLLNSFNLNPQSYYSKLAYLSAFPVEYGDNITYIDPIKSGLFTILLNAGAVKPRRDFTDTRVINDFLATGGRIINSQNEVGGYPKYIPTIKSIDEIKKIDADLDGMPDEWEVKNKLNPNDPADAIIKTLDGYTNLEVYLNGI